MASVDRHALQKDFRRWLSAPDPSTNHDIARKAHHTGTSAWFIEGETFRQWKLTGSLLWIHGKPGSGKSVLCSTIINNVRLMQEVGLATIGYLYADFRDPAKHSTRGLLSSLLLQLCIQSDDFCQILISLYSEHDRGLLQPIDDALIDCLTEMFKLPGHSPFYIIVDALDEYSNSLGFPSPREQTLEVVKILVGLNLPHLHFCVTSRPEVDIRVALAPSAKYSVSLHDEIGQNKDIASYVEATIQSDTIMRSWPEEFKRFVISTLVEKAGGMFLWTHCQLEALRRSPTREFWKELPPTLDGTYERALQRIDEETWECAHRIFQFLTVSDRPLRVEEVAEIFAIQTDEETTGIPEFDDSWRPANAEAAILSACSSLVTVVNVDGERIVQFSHFSVQDFLTGSRLASSEHLSRYHVVPRSAHTFLAKACLSVLLRLDTRIHKGSVKKDFPLASYAAEHWVGHARHGDVSSLIGHGNGMECLFDNYKPHFAAWLWVYDIDKPSGPHMVRAHPEKPEAAPLYYAASCGFPGLVQWLVKAHPGDINRINTQGSEGGNSLHAALSKGHLDIALFLLQHRADVNAKDNLRQTPLHIASRGGYTEVIRPLIAHGAHLNAKDRENKTPLALASRYGRVEAVQPLLKYGADVNHQDSYGSTPLHLALEQGCLPVARVLLEHFADVDARDASGWTPLHRASSGGKVEATTLLLDHKADVNARCQDDWTALRLAEHNGHRQIVDLLLQHGAESDIQKEEEREPSQVSPESNDATQVETTELRSKDGGGEKGVKPSQASPESNDATQVEAAEIRSKNGGGEKGVVPADV